MTCKHDVKRVTIDPSLLAEDKDMLEDLVAAAFNAAVRKAEETCAREDGQAHRRHARSARWHEIPLLIGGSARGRAMATSNSLDALDRGAAPPAGGGREVGRSAWRFTCCSTTARARCGCRRRWHQAVAQMRHCERCHTFSRSPGVRRLP